MSKIKKLLALVLALTMVLSATAFAGYTVAPYGDYAGIDADAEEAVQLLYSLNIMKGDNLGKFNPEATITRAEVAKMIYVILNYGEDDLAKNYTGAKFFSDVEAGMWYEGYVNYAASIKLVQGRPDGTFGPNDPVTCAEAAKMLLTAIGYSAEARGYVGAGWDQQVLSDASIIGLLDGYNYNTNTYAPRQWVAVMFFNALTEAYTYGNIAPVVFNGLLTGVNYDADYVNFGWKYFELYDWSGVITANEYADLYGDEPLSSGRTKIGKGEKAITFKNWTTTLDDIGEYREGWATGSKVLYVGGFDENVTFSTGDATVLSDSKFKSNTGLKKGGEYYVDFADASLRDTVNGEWLKVIDNDDDGTAEYVFITTFTMAAYEGMDSDEEIIYLSTGLETDEFVLAEDVAEDDIVIYTTIDGVTYVELAPSFSGEAAKYTYKTDALTVDGEDYVQSAIGYDRELDLFALVADAKKDTEYTYYQDFFGNIRLFGVDKADSGEFVLLTDAYYETNRNGSVAAVDAYLDGEIVDTDVRTSSSKTDIEMFIDERDYSNNAWNKLIKFEGKTNVARYTMSDEGVMSLYDAETWSYKTNGDKKQITTQYIDLDNVDVKAGTTKYEGNVVDVNETTGAKTVGADVTVQVNRDTVFYYIDADKNVKAVTGYKNSYDVKNEIVTIKAMYAVATNVEKDAAKAPYWVADVVVIETVTPVFNLKTNDIVLGYDIVNRTVNDYAYMDVVKADASLDALNVISHNGDDFDTFDEKGTLTVLNFFFNTVDEEGDSYLVDLTNYAAKDIYVGTVDRANKLYEYVTLVNGTETELVYTDATVVYDIDAATRYNKIATVSAGLQTGKDYIFFAPDGEIVYAVLCEADDALTRALYDAIANEDYVAPVIDPIAKALEKAGEVLAGTNVADMYSAVADLSTLAERFEDMTAAELIKAEELIVALEAKIAELEADAELAAAKEAATKAADAQFKPALEAETWSQGMYDAAMKAVAEYLADKTAVADINVDAAKDAGIAAAAAVKAEEQAAAADKEAADAQAAKVAEALATIQKITEIEVGAAQTDWASVQTAIKGAVDAVKNVEDETVVKNPASSYEPIAAGGYAEIVCEISFRVAGEKTATTITQTIRVSVNPT